MPVLVTGGAGYIGSQTVLELTDVGETVVVLDNLSTGFEAAVPPTAKPVFAGDVGNPALLASVITEHKIDAIIYFAGSVVVSKSVAHPLGYHHNTTCQNADADGIGG
jgi:UDP-glucose 4-epimerase